MNKILKRVNIIMIAINLIILISCYTHILDFSFIRITICTITVLALLITHLIEFKRRNHLLVKSIYNIILLSVNIITLVIFLRDLFDPLIPLGSYYDIALFNSNSSGIFIDYNAVFITIMYGGLFIYNLLNKNRAKQN